MMITDIGKQQGEIRPDEPEMERRKGIGVAESIPRFNFLSISCQHQTSTSHSILETGTGMDGFFVVASRMNTETLIQVNCRHRLRFVLSWKIYRHQGACDLGAATSKGC